jgi:hypothetical protein
MSFQTGLTILIAAFEQEATVFKGKENKYILKPVF